MCFGYESKFLWLTDGVTSEFLRPNGDENFGRQVLNAPPSKFIEWNIQLVANVLDGSMRSESCIISEKKVSRSNFWCSCWSLYVEEMSA
jgi:hypothetical protein